MRGNLVFLGGVGAGTGLMLLLDPAQGRRRRAIARDRIGRTMRGTSEAIGTTSSDLGHRLSGVAARLRRLTGQSPRVADAVSDAVLRDRVRARLGHVVSHPRAIHVVAERGRVVLTGAIPRAERPAAVSAIARVPGVQSLDDCLDDAADLETVAAISRAFAGRWPGRRSVTSGVLLGAVVASGLAIYSVGRIAREWGVGYPDAPAPGT